MTLYESAQSLQGKLVSLRREFHAHPELSGLETETAARIVRELQVIGGYSITTGVNGCGVVADLRVEGAENTVALRADMDALPVTEETGLPYASLNPGIMHACGHDAHITMLLGAARLLSERRDALRCHVRLLFQPSEELTPDGGAKGMIAAGVMQGVDAVFALHIWPGIPKGAFATRPGAFMAASDRFRIRIFGKGGHGARPQEGIDAVLAGAQLVTALQSIVSRNVDPLSSAVITVGRIQGGTRHNVLAEQCELEGTVRTYDQRVRSLCADRIREMAEGIASAMGCRCELWYGWGYCPVNNDSRMTEYLLERASGLFGAENALRTAEPSMTAEDFAFYLNGTPGCLAWLGIDEPGQPVWPLHNGHLTVAEDVLWRGSALLAALALDRNN